MNVLRSLTLGLFIFSSSILFSQSNKIDIGIEAGPSLKSLRGSDFLESSGSSVGFSGGLTFQYNFTKLFSLRTNISYERKGSEMDFLFTDEFGNQFDEITLRSNFDYLTIPLLARFTFGEKLRFHVNAGPNVGYLVKQADILDAYATIPESETNNIDVFERLDFGLTTGLGVSYPILNNLLLSMEVRNNLGLININSLANDNGGNTKTVSTNLLVGIAYQLGKKDS